GDRNLAGNSGVLHQPAERLAEWSVWNNGWCERCHHRIEQRVHLRRDGLGRIVLFAIEKQPRAQRDHGRQAYARIPLLAQLDLQQSWLRRLVDIGIILDPPRRGAECGTGRDKRKQRRVDCLARELRFAHRAASVATLRMPSTKLSVNSASEE